MVGDGVYDGPLADYTNDWDALFAYATEGDATSTASRETNTDERVYRVGEEYRDSRNPDADQFQSWIRGPLDTGIGATAGIRVFKGEAGPYADQTTAVVWVSSETADPEGSNPWTDEFLIEQGTIRYWGDAKRETQTEDVDEDAFPGTQQLRAVHRANQQDGRDQYPPILVFRKPESGVVEFAGLCVIEQLEVDEFRQQGVPTPNYLCHLAVLDVPEVPVR